MEEKAGIDGSKEPSTYRLFPIINQMGSKRKLEGEEGKSLKKGARRSRLSKF